MPLPLLPEQAEIEANFDEQFVTELGQIDFAEALPDSTTPEQLDKAAPAMLRYLLQSGDNGYKDGVDEISDDAGNPPSQANNWLWDSDLNGWKGKFTDRRAGGDRVFSFEITKNGDGWDRSFVPISGVSDDA